MLVELMIENYAVIEKMRVRFHAGFNVLSGETGSGKSIVVDALGLLFGGRASAEMVRTGADRARVAGIFELPENAGIECEDGELLIEREILTNGKSRAFAASRPVTASVLKELAPLAGDIHGQHDQQRLFDRGEQLEMLDAFARDDAALEETAARYREWRNAQEELEQFDRTEQERLRMADLWAHQVKEIEAVSPKPGEDEALEQERRVLQNVSKLQSSATAAFDALYDSPESAVSQMRQARKRAEELARIDPALAGLVESIQSAEGLVEDASFTLRDYLGKLEADPARLEQVESRLAALERLKRKYGGAVAAILEFFETTRGLLESAESAESRRSELMAEAAQRASAFREAAQRLSAVRRESARKLEKKVESELGALAMERTRFRVSFSDAAWSARGADAVEFLIAANAGEEPKALDRIASGGELSRVALALKTCLVGSGRDARGPQRTLVFDEVDAGIGGRAAETVGRRLKALAAGNQVLCVTHLAQIAGFADHHFVVEKRETKGRTHATIEELTGVARTREIGRMLSGHVTPEALKHAELLIRQGASG